MKPVPVLLACQNLNIGGSERQVAETAIALNRSHFEPHVLTFRAEGIRLEGLKRAGVPVLELPVRSFRNFAAVRGARQMRQYVREHGIRLVHGFDVPMAIFLTFGYAFRNRPVVLTSQRAHRDLTGPGHRVVLRTADRLADGIVVNCEFMRRHLMDDEGVPPERIQLCYNGIDVRQFSPGPATRPVALQGADPLIGTVCALRPEKGLPTLLGAFAVVHASRLQARLLLVGSGPELPRLEQMARQLGIADAVVFEPLKSDVVPWLRMLDIFVLPSLSEAFSNSIMEAMACGVPVVASNVGGNPELTGEHVERGHLFQVSDRQRLAEMLLHLAGNPEERAQLSAAARQWVEQNLAMPVAVARMGEIYDKYLG